MERQKMGPQQIPVYVWVLEWEDPESTESACQFEVRFDRKTPDLTGKIVYGDQPLSFAINPSDMPTSGLRRRLGYKPGRDQFLERVAEIIAEGGERLEWLKWLILDAVYIGHNEGRFPMCDPYLFYVPPKKLHWELFDSLNMLGRLRSRWFIGNIGEAAFRQADRVHGTWRREQDAELNHREREYQRNRASPACSHASW